jgi:hypothetical protein
VIHTEPRELIARWVLSQIRDEVEYEGFFALPYQTLGFGTKKGALVGGVVYHTHRGTTLEAMAAGMPGWLTPLRARAMFDYGFNTLKSDVLIVHAAKANKRSRHFIARLGFVERGCVPRAIHGKDAVIYSLHRDDCRWLKGGSPVQGSQGT